MISRSPISKIYIATQSQVKTQALKNVILAYSSFYPGTDAIVAIDVQPEENPAQPVNTGFQCAYNRLIALMSQVKEQGVDVESSEVLFLSIESAITTSEEEGVKDVCYAIGQRGNISLQSFSVPIVIPAEWNEKWLATSPEAHKLGYTSTFGEFVAGEIPGISSNNWMIHENFGSNDRGLQI